MTTASVLSGKTKVGPCAREGCEESRAKSQTYCADHTREYRRAWSKTPEGRLKAKRDAIKRLYGLTLKEYDEILSNNCEICGGWTPPHQYKGILRSSMHLDHDHETGQVRGVLCSGCNTALGAFGDDPDRLRAAIRYLAAHNAARSQQEEREGSRDCSCQHQAQ